MVIFDSTYHVNRYSLPFVPFVGANHHRSTIIFGCGILSNESVSSYVWLLQTLLEAMHQKHPKSLITDGDASMAKAITKVMPNTDHRLCSWHIEENMKCHLRRQKLADFKKFLYDAMDVDDFERCWVEYKAKYGFNENNLWISMMYELRKKWSTAYMKGTRFLGMRSNQRSESLNSRLHRHLDRKMSLVDLVEHYEFCLSRIRRNEAVLDARASQSVSFTTICADPLEKSAARIYMPAMFKKVWAEIRKLYEWEVFNVARQDGAGVFTVASKDNNVVQVHVWCTFEEQSMNSANCDCKKLECDGIPCSHVCAVLKFLGVGTIPHCCVMVRWTMDVKAAFESDRSTNTHVWSEQMDCYRDLRNMSSLALFIASKSS